MLFTTFQKATRLPRTDLNIVLDNATLDNVDSEKLLGVIVDKYLTGHIMWTRLQRLLLKTLPYFVE